MVARDGSEIGLGGGSPAHHRRPRRVGQETPGTLSFRDRPSLSAKGKAPSRRHQSAPRCAAWRGQSAYMHVQARRQCRPKPQG